MKLSEEIKQAPNPTSEQLARWIDYAQRMEEIIDLVIEYSAIRSQASAAQARYQEAKEWVGRMGLSC